MSVNAADQAALWRALVAILHLGNVAFGAGEVAAVGGGEARAALASAAQLLQVDAEHLQVTGCCHCRHRLVLHRHLHRQLTSNSPPPPLQTGMCARRFKAGAEWVTSPSTAEQAGDVRHALAKLVYAAAQFRAIPRAILRNSAAQCYAALRNSAAGFCAAL